MMMDALDRAIGESVRKHMRHELNVSESNRRMLSVKAAAEYLGLSVREIYTVIQEGELVPAKHKTRTLLDIRDLDEWIAKKKVGTR